MPDTPTAPLCESPSQGLDLMRFSSQGKPPKIFQDQRDNTPENRREWMDGIQAAYMGDARGVLRALSKARGQARLLNSRGKPARNPIAAHARKLLPNPHAWSRLMESQPFWSYEPDPDDFPEARIYRRHDTSAKALLWAISPETVANAATLWRSELAASRSFVTSSPFFQTIWDGPVQLACWISAPSARHFEPSKDTEAKRPCSATPGLAPDPAERACLARILEELARASIQERFPGLRRAAIEREARPEATHHINHTWAAGLRWHGSSFDISSPGTAPRTALESAIDAILGEASRSSIEDFFDQSRLCILAGVEGSAEPLAKRAVCAWLGAHPDSPIGLPLLAFDRIRKDQLDRILPRSLISDRSLGRWLALTGKSWRAPATFGYSCRLEEATSQWGLAHIHVPEHLANEVSSSILATWTVCEWLAGSRPAAVREACLNGYALADGLEAALSADKSGCFSPSGLPETLAAIEACRLATASQRDPAPNKRRNSI